MPDDGTVPEADPKAQRVRLIEDRNSVSNDPEETPVAHVMDRGRRWGNPVISFLESQ
jgi:hypothetical protein